MVFAHKACDPDHSKYQLGLTGLAAAYAETGDFEQAVNLQNKALQLLEAMQQKLGTFGFGYRESDDLLRSEMEDRLSLYEQGKPCHKIMGLTE